MSYSRFELSGQLVKDAGSEASMLRLQVDVVNGPSSGPLGTPGQYVLGTFSFNFFLKSRFIAVGIFM